MLEGLTMQVAPGETVALLGRNGTGKSTLLRILATILRPTAGSGRVFGRELERERDEVRGSLGYLGHGSGLYDGMTVKENLWLAGRLRGTVDLAARVAAAVASSGLEPYRDTMVRHLSKGLARRAAIERVMLHEPRLLLLDEPFEGLDPDGQAGLAARLLAHRKGGGTALLVTHDIPMVQELATRALVLRGGRIVHDVAPSALDRSLLQG